MSVDGYSLGWGKKSGGTLKNHYPKDCGSSINRRRKNPPASEP
ncbi:MAG: methyltransferase RsmF C-terminal domain-like protein [Clostridium fessum]